MALQVSATPVLEGEDAKDFLRRVRELARVPSKPLDAEKVEKTLQAIKRVLKARREGKQ